VIGAKFVCPHPWAELFDRLAEPVGLRDRQILKGNVGLTEDQSIEVGKSGDVTVQLIGQHMSPLEQVRRRQVIDLGGSVRQLSADDQAILQQVLAGKYEYVKNPTFGRANAKRRLFDQAPEIALPDTSWYHLVMDSVSDAAQWNAKSTRSVLLTAEEERVLFFQFNYCRYRVFKLKEKIKKAAGSAIKSADAFELLDWYRKAEELRVQIAATNLALVLAMAKRTRMTDIDFADLVSEGNMALLRAIDKFDASRGFKFSTYGCRAILKAFSRSGVKFMRYRLMFPMDFDPKLERSDYLDIKRAGVESDCADEVKQILKENRAELTQIEHEVIRRRFAIDHAAPGQIDPVALTLEQVGRIIGVTKERVRQIQNKALDKIRQSLESDYLG